MLWLGVPHVAVAWGDLTLARPKGKSLLASGFDRSEEISKMLMACYG